MNRGKVISSRRSRRWPKIRYSRTVLARVQERVDEAFNTSEGKREEEGQEFALGEVNEEIQRKQECSHDCQQELQKTAGD